MKILQICNKPPYPPHEGGSIAMHNITMGLINAGHQIKVLAISSYKNTVSYSDLPDWYLKTTNFESVFVDLKINPIFAFLNLFSKKSYHVHRFISDDFKNKIIEILKIEKFDIIQLETLFLTPYVEVIKTYSNAKIVLRAHNIEHLIWERIATETKNPFKKFYLNHLSKTLKNYETEAVSKYDGLASISKNDAVFFRNLNFSVPIIDISFGVDVEDYTYRFSQENTALFHIGAMNWIPNQEGMKWFILNVWQQITDDFPDLEFYIAGRKMPDWFSKLKYSDLHIIGEVENAKEFIQSKGIMIVPLFSGSGIRIKIIEAMALGKVVISTKTGAEGINYMNRENILIANNADEFKLAVKEIINDGNLRKKIAENARLLVEKEHNNKTIIDKLTEFYFQLINKK